MTSTNDTADLALQDHVLVETEVAGRPVGFRAVVVKIGPEELWLGLTSPDHRLETLKPGRPIGVTVARPGYALVGRSAFIRHLGENRSRIFAVASLGALERVQRRAHPRIDIDMEVSFRRVDPATGQARGKAVAGRTINAGPGGLLFRPGAPLEDGEDLEMTLSPSGGERLAAAAHVTRVGQDPRPGDGGQPPTPVAAVRFTRITALDQQRLLKACMLAEHRRQVAARQAAESAAASVADAAVPAAPQPPTPAAVPDPAAIAAVPDPAAIAAAVARARAARLARLAASSAASATPAAGSAAIESPTSVSPVQDRLPGLPPDAPLVQVGLAMCEVAGVAEIRRWFDTLEPFDRIGVLSQLQANMHGEAVDGAPEPYSAQPLAQALGLIQKSA